jgi:hypothetical protein
MLIDMTDESVGKIKIEEVDESTSIGIIEEGKEIIKENIKIQIIKE